MRASFFKHTPRFPFTRWRGRALALAGLVLAAGLWSLFFGRGLELGSDFAGGATAQVAFARPLAPHALQSPAAESLLPGLSVQNAGDDGTVWLLKFQGGLAPLELRARLEQVLALAAPGNPAAIERLDAIGPKVGRDLADKALLALYLALAAVAVYVSGRFEGRWLAAGAMALLLWAAAWPLKLLGLGAGAMALVSLALALAAFAVLRLAFALGATLSLVHDVLATLGILSLIGVAIDLNVLAAVLSIIGYSLNDTIVVYDRLRENLRARLDMPLNELIDLSVNQTLSRTLLTSGTTLLAVLALLLLGGGVIWSFAATMFTGVVAGTFSSIFIASPLLEAFGDTAFYAETCRLKDWERPGEHGMV